VAYELDLPKNNNIHNVFHVSHLKKVSGQHITPCSELPRLDDEGKLILELKVIIDMREKKLRNKVILEYLVKWKNLLLEDATQEGIEIFDHPNLKLLKGNQFGEGKTVMSPPPHN